MNKKKIVSYVIPLVLVVAFFIQASLALADGTVSIIKINGQPPAATCLVSPITIEVAGTNGTQNGGNYFVDINWGDGTTDADIPTGGKGASFDFTRTHTMVAVSTGLSVLLHHSNAAGNDSHFTLNNLCSVPPTTAVLTVKKHVINDSIPAGTATASSFTIHVKNSANVDVVDGGNGVSSPTSGSETGKDFVITPTAGIYTISENAFPGYTQTGITGDCAVNGTITLVAGNNYVCTITNNDNVNTPPTLSGVPSTATIPELALYTFTATAVDSDVPAQTLTFSLVGNPPGASINSSTGVFSWTPTEAQGPGTYPFTVRVSDGTNNTDAAITITVNEVNISPTLFPIGAKSVNENALLQFTLFATDPDLPANTLVFSASNLPAGATFDGVTRTFSWTPTYTQAGVYPLVHFAVSDGTVTAAEDITITVNNVNRAPVLDAIGNKTGNEGDLLTFGISGTDPDGDALTYSATGLPAGASFDTSTQTFSWTSGFGQAGNYSITFSVSDGSLSDSEIVPIDIGNVNRAPVLGLIGDKATPELTPLAFTASAIDPDGDALTYSATGLPAGASFNTITGAFMWMPTEAQGPGTYTVTISATDGSLADSETFDIVVSEVNVAPVPNNDTVTTDEDVTITIPRATLLANDTDADIPTQTLTLLSVSNGTHGTPSVLGTDVIFAPDANYNGSAGFDYTITDGVITATAHVVVTVTPVNDAPTITLLGSNPLSLVAGNPFVDPGATSTDIEDGSLPVTTTGTVSTSTPGTYTLTYSVTDSSDATASTTRTVIVTAAPVENTAALCSDGIDNDGDGLIDLADPDCAAFIPPTPPPSGGGSSGGGGLVGQGLGDTGGSITPISVAPSAPQGQVLGATASCGLSLNSYIKYGTRNDSEQVKKLQSLLNDIMGSTLPMSGFYGPKTRDVVSQFQVKYAAEVLRPWVAYGLKSETTPTGYVYKTTKRWINMLKCPELALPIPQLP